MFGCAQWRAIAGWCLALVYIFKGFRVDFSKMSPKLFVMCHDGSGALAVTPTFPQQVGRVEAEKADFKPEPVVLFSQPSVREAREIYSVDLLSSSQ
jgi:hypothetical protein